MAARRRSIPNSVQDIVRERANGLCEYCHTSEKWQYVQFTIDHITALSLGGTDDVENLALACFHCNRRKSNQTTVVDPESGKPYVLFNPRHNKWADHFAWSRNGAQLLGQTPTGRATVSYLNLNRPRIMSIRLADVAIGRHPPANDPLDKTTQ